MTKKIPAPRWRIGRMIRSGLILVVLLSLMTIAAVPTIMSTAPGRRVLLDLANDQLAPTRVHAESVRLSWGGSISMTGLTLSTADGKTVVSAPRANLSRSVWQLLTDRPRYGTLTLHEAVVDIERRADGSIDLAEALDPLIGGDPDEPGNPATDFTLIVVKGTLRLMSPELAKPLNAERLDMTLRVPASPEPLSWEIELANPSADNAEGLAIHGNYDQRAASEAATNMVLTVEGTRWPVAFALAGMTGTTRLDGRLALSGQERGWATKGGLRLLDLDVAGPALRGDHLRLDRLDAVWDVADEDGSWAIRRLDLASRLAALKAEGTVATATDASARVTGSLDLAALARHLPNALYLRDGIVLERGVLELDASIRPEPDGQHLEVVASASELAATYGSRALTWNDPATLEIRALRTLDDTVVIERVAASTEFLNASGSGDLKDGVTLDATLDLDKLMARVGEWVELGERGLAGHVRMAGRYAAPDDTYRGQLAAEFRDLTVNGVTTDPLAWKSLRLDATSTGGATAIGLPTDWSDIRIKLLGNDLSLDLTAGNSADEAAEVRLDLATSVRYDGHDGQVELNLAGRRSGQAIDLNRARFVLMPAGAESQSARLAFASRGRLDLDAGTLTLETPADNAGTDPLRLLGEGLQITGLGRDGEPLAVGGQLLGDLMVLDRAIAYWTGGTPVGVAGNLAAAVNARRDPDGLIHYGLRLESADLARFDGQQQRVEGPISVQSRGSYGSDSDRLDLAELAISSRYGDLATTGSLAELSGRRLADLQGTIAPNWSLINEMVADAIEPGAQVRAEVRPFHIRGQLSGASTADILRGLDADVGLDLAEASAFGVQVGSTPILVHFAGGEAVIEPITTTINGGQLTLQPELAIDEWDGITFRLASGSAIRGAEINEEVSSRVLSYIAPVLHEATQARGRLSADFDRTEIPITGAADRSSVVVGRIAFHEVTYGPGPLAQQLLGLVGESRIPALRLDRTIKFWVSEGRVGQEGLVVDVNRDVQIALDGSVGFDSTLALRAGVPITGAMLGGGNDLVGQIVGGTRVGVPIGGTFSQPRLDRDAMQVGLREMSRSLIRRGAAAGASELLQQIVPGTGAASGEGDPAQSGLEQLPQEALRRLFGPPTRTADPGRPAPPR